MSRQPVPVIENSIEIDADPERVWQVVSEVRNAPEWSDQAWKVFALGGRTKLGTFAVNLNRQNGLIWPTTSTVVEYEPGRRIANRITENFTVWAFELEPTARGTRLIERRETPRGISSYSNFLVDRFFKGQENFREVLSGGVSTSLKRIKHLAEQG